MKAQRGKGAAENTMPNLVESISVFNSTLRTLLAVVVVSALSAGGWYAYTAYNAGELEARQRNEELAQAQGELAQAKQQLGNQNVLLQQQDADIDRLENTVTEQKEQIARLDTALRLLKIDHRVARLKVIEQQTDYESGELISVVEFQELDDRGQPVDDARQFRVPGDVIYVDSWIVKFDDKYVEQADLHRSTSLVLFRRIFGAAQQPRNGFSLDRKGLRPRAYGRGGKLSDFEKKIWDDFWSVANDEQKQAKLGIRAAHGEAPSIKVEKGKAYRIMLRASGGLTVDPETDAEAETKPAA